MGWDIPPLRRTSSRPEPPERSPQRAPPPPLPPSRCGASALGACGPAPGDGPPPWGGEAPPPPPRAPGPPRRPSRPAAVRGARPPPPAPSKVPEAGRNDPRSPATPPPVPSKVCCSSGDFLCRPRGRLGSPGAGRGAVGGCSGSQARLEALPPRVPARAGPPRPPAAAAAAASACRSRECQVNNESVIYFLWCPDGRGNGGPRGGGGGRGGARIRGTTRAGKPAFVGGPVISPPPAPSPPLVWPLLQLLGWRELRGLGSQVVRPRGDDLP